MPLLAMSMIAIMSRYDRHIAQVSYGIEPARKLARQRRRKREQLVIVSPRALNPFLSGISHHCITGTKEINHHVFSILALESHLCKHTSRSSTISSVPLPTSQSSRHGQVFTIQFHSPSTPLRHPLMLAHPPSRYSNALFSVRM